MYSYNKNYFKTIDTKDKAYWLGFIAADGSIINKGAALEIGLNASCYNHLAKFVSSIDGDLEMIKFRTTGSGVTGKEHDVARIRVCCKELCRDLAKYDIVPQKGFILDFPYFLDKTFIPSYLRGYFDGDGSISTNGKNRNGSPKWAINLIATESFLNGLMDYLEAFGITRIKLQSQNMMKIWNKVGIHQIRTVLNLFYGDSECSLYLDKKYSKYLDLCSPRPNSH